MFLMAMCYSWFQGVYGIIGWSRRVPRISELLYCMSIGSGGLCWLSLAVIVLVRFWFTSGVFSSSLVIRVIRALYGCLV